MDAEGNLLNTAHSSANESGHNIRILRIYCRRIQSIETDARSTALCYQRPQPRNPAKKLNHSQETTVGEGGAIYQIMSERPTCPGLLGSAF